MDVLSRGLEIVDFSTVFPTIGVDTKGGGGGGANPRKLVNGKRFLLENCMVLAEFGVFVTNGQFPPREAQVVAFGQLFLGELFLDMTFCSFSIDHANC